MTRLPLVAFALAFAFAPGAASAQVAEVHPGGAVSCERIADGRVRCWGTGPLGDGRAPDDADGRYFARGVGSWLAGSFHRLAVGGFACATDARGVACWGELAPDRVAAVPERIAAPGGVTSLAVGRGHACVAAERGVQCWGRNDEGQLGDGSRHTRAQPVAVRGLRGAVSDLAVGDAHTCAIVDDGEGRAAWCWGAGPNGELGTGARVDVTPTPQRVTVLEASPVELAAGAHHTCARLEDGSVRCWGQGSSGELGGVEFAVDHAATVALPEPALELAASGFTVCARAARSVYCWGALPSGESTRTPTVVTLPGPASSLSVGRGRACVVVDGAGYCWGDNQDGQLDGTSRPSAAQPVPVPGP